MTTLAWFRRDLRLHDHAVLAAAMAHAGPVQPVFVFDSDILARFSNPNDRRLGFIASALCNLHAELKKRGGGMLVLHGSAAAVIPKLSAALKASHVIAAEDFEPATRARDAAVAKALAPNAVFQQPLDHLIHHPARMVKDDGTAYRVFTPFFKNWSAALNPTSDAVYDVSDHGRYADFSLSVSAAMKSGLKVIDIDAGPAATLQQIGYEYRADSLWDAAAGPQQLALFIAERLAKYATARDALAVQGTSRLSPYLRHGMVSIRECMRAAQAHGGGAKWISELAWREFYGNVMFHFPEVVDHEFQEHYRGTIPWSNDARAREAFLQGQTGYPVVDAAMRELLETGFMHNRARMIVASFASKDLLLDWRIGEEFFAQHLMDYELASNNGGWQWAASTGTDAAPYFRIFNPILQGKKFDAKGEYVRRYVPEIAHLSDADLHAPWESANPPAGYPAPIVDHGAARAKALAAYKRTE